MDPSGDYLGVELMGTGSQRMPTGIGSFDPVMEGGVPPGSIMLLLGDIGAGSFEFVYTSLINLATLKRRDPGNPALPSEILYITFTKMKEDVHREVSLSFDEAMASELETDYVRFSDLSEQYFENSSVPNEWYTSDDLMTRLRRRSDHKSTLMRISSVLETAPQRSLIILDSLTELAVSCSDPQDWKELAAYLRGLQRITKRWNSTIYLLLTQGIIDRARVQEVADIADSVILYRWEESVGARRQRVMFFEKFRGVMTHLEENDLVKFSIKISPALGFEVNNIRLII
jgi:KaiC/GvpD/RAD55 family RecA-like ATPase